MLSGSHRKREIVSGTAGSANNKQPVYPSHKIQNLIFLQQHQIKNPIQFNLLLTKFTSLLTKMASGFLVIPVVMT